ncbi:MAG: HIT domain-containing protein [Nitrospirota bacterium]
MKSLWAPWRLPYLKGKKPDHCIFCVGDGPRNGRPPALRSNDRRRYILHRNRLTFVIMNAFPYSNGHLMVAPYRHVANLGGLTFEEMGELLASTQLAISVLGSVYHPDGFNVGINLGKAAGAGIEAHLHVHIVPRWNGDTNFMSTVADTRVIPESLDHAYKQLLPAFIKFGGRGRISPRSPHGRTRSKRT